VGCHKAAEAFAGIAATAKGLEFTLARAARGRKVDLAGPFDEMEQAWDTAMDTLLERYGADRQRGSNGAGVGDLVGASWTCCATVARRRPAPGRARRGPRLEWVAASVPGTAAGAVAADLGMAGRHRSSTTDGSDWWFRCRLPAVGDDEPGGGNNWTPALDVTLEGLATVADVWFRGQHVAAQREHVRPPRTGLEVAADDELSVRFAALNPAARAAPAPAPVEDADGRPSGSAVVPDHAIWDGNRDGW
jgi:hypothetical protein